MSERLARFLISLSEDPYKVDRFLADPDSVLAQTDLDPAERAAVRSGDAGEIERILGGLTWFSTSSTTKWRPHPPPWAGGGGKKGGPPEDR